MPEPGREPIRKRLAAVVLYRTNYGEADLIVTFLTRELGLVSGLARYGRRSIRRFGGGLLTPGVSAWYDFTIKPTSSLAFVENGEENPQVRRLPPDPVVQSLAAFGLELVKGFEAPGNPAEESFNLLVRHLGRLARSEDERTSRLLALDFALKYLELAGFGPRLTGCIVCGNVPETKKVMGRYSPSPAESPEHHRSDGGALPRWGDGWRWDPAAGGLYCPNCARPGLRGSRPVSPALLARLCPPDSAGESPLLTEGDLAEAELFFEKLAEHHLGYSLKAMKTARRLYKAGGR